MRRELKFFESTAAKYGLDLEVRPDGEGGDGVSKGVKGYRDLFNEVGEGIEKGEKGVLDGMVVLWGTEKVCLIIIFSLSAFFPCVLNYSRAFFYVVYGEG